jgi:hypothetical protein
MASSFGGVDGIMFFDSFAMNVQPFLVNIVPLYLHKIR